MVFVAAIVLALLAIRSGTSLSGLFALLRPAPEKPLAGEPLSFSLPEGFTARLYSDAVPGARVMERDPYGSILVSLPRKGSVVAIRDGDGDGFAEDLQEVVGGLNAPHGLSFACDEFGVRPCELYIAEEDAVRSYSYDEATRTATLKETIAELPHGDGHSTRSLMLHPDGKRLLVSIGSSCNVCEESDPRRAAIFAINVGTKEMGPFASGLRNTVFMTTHPVTGEIWGTDMGRDLLGDDIPPEEVNIIREGAWYGWPWYYGKNTLDKTFLPDEKPTVDKEPTASHIDMQAHSAPLGLAFIPEEGWPEKYWFDLIVAFHGSWNRSIPTGYKLVRIDLDAEGNFSGTIDDFMTGFMVDGDVIGRPVALLVEPGGVMYVSDDRAGAIYRITLDLLE